MLNKKYVEWLNEYLCPREMLFYSYRILGYILQANIHQLWPIQKALHNTTLTSHLDHQGPSALYFYILRSKKNFTLPSFFQQKHIEGQHSASRNKIKKL